jgi:ribosomal protein L37AE/L43A
VQDLKPFPKMFKTKKAMNKKGLLLSSRYKRKIMHKKNFKLQIHSCKDKLSDCKDKNHIKNSVFAFKIWICSPCVMVCDINGENVVVAIFFEKQMNLLRAFLMVLSGGYRK